MSHCIENQLDELAATVAATRAILPAIAAGGNMLADCLRSGGTILTCGNGGSATDAIHLAEELTGCYKNHRRALSAICLNADSSALTCIGNDFGFEAIFSRQIEAIGREGDVLVGFTTSGNSPNVLAAFRQAAQSGIKTILLGGKSGGKAAGTCDLEVIVPGESTARIQELHTFILHQWLEIVEKALF